MDVSPDLQTRINNANPGDVINVEAGTFGPITINKPLTLIGSGSGTVIDGGSATAIIIASNGVNVSSLSAICGADMVGTITVNGHFNKIDNVTVKNDRSEGWSRYAIHFSSSSSNNSVYDSTVFDSIIGVMADGSHNNTVSGNTFIDNSLEDIRLVSSSDSLVIGNDISAETGVKVWEDSYRNVIDGNLFSFGNTGVLVHDANENAITNNTIVGCRRSIEIESGSSFNDITNNTISGHDEFAVSITGGQSNLIEGNTIHSGHTGIVIQGPSPGNEIVGNDIFTQGNAIEVHGVGSLSVEDNNLSNNTGYALLIEDSEQLDIQSNEFIQNAVGLHLDNVTGTEIAPIMVQENVFWSNGVGSSSMEATYIIYYENLFWNDTLGLHVDNSSWVLVLLNDFLDEDVAAEVNDSEMVNADHNDVLRCGQGLVFTRTLAPTLLENDILETPYGILLDGCEEAFLEENHLNGSEAIGIRLQRSNNGSLMNNTIEGCHVGMSLENVTLNFSVLGNILTGNDVGVHLDNVSDLTFFNNTVMGNQEYGIGMFHTDDSLLYGNAFIGNGYHLYWDGDGVNLWNESYPIGGNFWDDYTGVDEFSGTYQNEPGADGIGDTAYSIAFSITDYHPLMDGETPVADAGDDLTVDQHSTVTLDGSGSEDNIAVTDWNWTFVDGEPVELHGQTCDYTFHDAGVFLITLNVTDSSWNWDTDTVTITVNDTELPEVDAGDDQTVDMGDTVTFDGSGSTDNVAIDNYTWTFNDGSDDVTLYELGPSHRFDNAGIFIVTLTVNDTAGNINTSTVTITVNDTEDPVAEAGMDRTVDQNSMVMLDGSGSTDNVDIVSWTWTFIDDGPRTLNGQFVNFTFLNAGEFNITLNVSDAAGNWHTDNLTVTVNDTELPEVDAGLNQTVDMGDTVTFDGSGSADNVAIDNYTWTFNDGTDDVILYGIGPAYRFDDAGVFVVTLTVNDTAGNINTSTVTITVNDTEDPVAVAVVYPHTLGQGEEVILNGSGSTDNVDVVSWTWTFQDGGLQILTGENVTYTFLTAGTHVVTLNVTDAAGNWNTTTLTVTVNDTEEPVTDAGLNQTVDMGGTVTLNGSGSTDNVEIFNYTWTFNDGTDDVTLYGAENSHAFLKAGTYIVTLNVTDTNGNWREDIMTVTVNDTQDPVSICVRYPSTAGQNEAVIFNGSGSTDNVAVLNWTWTFDDDGLKTLYGENVTYSFLTAGVHVLTLNVTDAAGNWNVSNVTVTITDTEAPQTDAGADQWVDMGGTVTFNGSGSTDNVEIFNYTWTFNDSTGDITLYGAGPAHQFDVPGTYVVTLNVTDTSGNWREDSMTVTVNDTEAPVADAAADRVVDQGDTVTFNGTASTDNVGIVNYSWTFDDGGLQTVYGVNAVYVFQNAGSFNVTLNVSDAAGNWHTDNLTVTVNDTEAPVADPGEDQNVNINGTVSWNGTSSTDNVGIVNYTWTFFDGVENITLYGATVQHQFSVLGDYLVTLNVSDAVGNWNTSSMTVSVLLPVTFGPVLDGDGNPLVGATVTVVFDNVSYNGTTGADGSVLISLPGAALGQELTVTVSMQGYQPYSTTTLLDEDGSIDLESMTLEPEDDYMLYIYVGIAVAALAVLALLYFRRP